MMRIHGNPAMQEFDDLHVTLIANFADKEPLEVFQDGSDAQRYVHITMEPPTISLVAVANQQCTGFRLYRTEQEIGMQHCTWPRARAGNTPEGQIPTVLGAEHVKELGGATVRHTLGAIRRLLPYLAPSRRGPGGGYTA